MRNLYGAYEGELDSKCRIQPQNFLLFAAPHGRFKVTI